MYAASVRFEQQLRLEKTCLKDSKVSPPEKKELKVTVNCVKDFLGRCRCHRVVSSGSSKRRTKSGDHILANHTSQLVVVVSTITTESHRYQSFLARF